jgi:hypothetical protein
VRKAIQNLVEHGLVEVRRRGRRVHSLADQRKPLDRGGGWCSHGNPARRVFGKDKVTMFEMNKHLARHLK